MFILSLRDAYGLKISIRLILIWNVYFFVALYAGTAWLSLLMLSVSIAATCYGCFRLCKYREDLIFANIFTKEHAFPSSARNVQATFNMHLSAFLVFFLGPLLATSIVDIRPLAVEKMPLLYLGFLLGLPGVVGMTQHFVRKVAVRRGA